jgi:hypothetical protein
MPVTDPNEVDDALELAIDRTIRAQDEFESTESVDPAAVPKASVVVRRAEDVDELAREADVARAPASHEGEPSSGADTTP